MFQWPLTSANERALNVETKKHVSHQHSPLIEKKLLEDLDSFHHHRKLASSDSKEKEEKKKKKEKKKMKKKKKKDKSFANHSLYKAISILYTSILVGFLIM